MRDDGHRWQAAQTAAAQGVTITPVDLPEQRLISGIDVLARYGADLIAWPDIAMGACYTLSLRRDRVLRVGDPTARLGYDAKTGLAGSDIADGYMVYDIAGPGALACLKQGAELRLDQPSRSVLRQLFGIDVMVYRTAAHGFRVHVPRPMAMAFLQHVAQPQT